MFYYKKEKEGYYIWSDHIKGKFGPFLGIYCKNKYLGNMGGVENDTLDSLEQKYPGYKYSFGEANNKIFIINEKGIEEIQDK